MDYKAILNLMKEMNNTDLTKLEVEEEGIRICLEKAAPIVAVAQSPMSQVTMATQIPTVASMNSMGGAQIQSQVTMPTESSAIANAASEKQTEEVAGKRLVSPMVGTFYAQSSPDKPPFVKVGDKVKKGQTICIIEAMKLMNEIESEHDGEVVKVLMKNEDMVEFGQPLFLIK